MLLTWSRRRHYVLLSTRLNQPERQAVERFYSREANSGEVKKAGKALVEKAKTDFAPKDQEPQVTGESGMKE